MTSKLQETAKQHKAIFQGHCLQHNERQPPGREIGSQAVTSKDGFMQSPDTVSAISHSSFGTEVSFLVFSWLWFSCHRCKQLKNQSSY